MRSFLSYFLQFSQNGNRHERIGYSQRLCGTHTQTDYYNASPTRTLRLKILIHSIHHIPVIYNIHHNTSIISKATMTHPL